MARTPRKWTGARSPSGLKRVRSSERRHEVLGPRRAAAKTLVRRAVDVATDPGDLDPQATLAEAMSALDRAAKTGAIHPNAAARRKARLAWKVNDLLAGMTVVAKGKARTAGKAKTVGKAQAQKAAKARIAAGKAGKAKGAQTAAGKARAALSKTTRAEAAAESAQKAPAAKAAPVKAAARTLGKTTAKKSTPSARTAIKPAAAPTKASTKATSKR